MAEADKEEVKEVKKASAKMLSEVGQPGLVTSNSFVKELGKKELSVPNIYFTFDQMVQSPVVSDPLNLSRAIQINPLADGYYESTGSRLSQALADYGNYIIHNMEYLTWAEAVSNLNTHIKNGFSINEISATRAKAGKYKGDLVLRNLGPRSPKSIYAQVWDKYKRRLTHIVQNPLQDSEYKIQSTTASYLGNYVNLNAWSIKDLRSNFNKFPVLSMDKLVYNIYDATMSNPQGNSPLVAAYQPWQEMSIVSEYEIIGVARNFGGVPVARVPDQLLIDANNPDCPEYNDARKSLDEIQTDLENAHAGKQAFFLLPSNMVEGTNQYAWDLKLLGIDGGTGNFDVTEIINRKTTDIYRAFNATHLNLGMNGTTTSYSRAEVGTNYHSYIVERDLRATANSIEKLLASMLKAQGFEYDKRDLPKFRWKTPDQLSLDEVGKFIQRTKSVQGMTPKMLETVLKWADIPTDNIDDIDFSDKGQSRSGEGMGTSGTGVGGQENSSTNMENKQLSKPKDWVVDDYKDGKGALLDENGDFIRYVDIQ